MNTYWFWNWAPESMDKAPAPPPNPYPFGPNLRPWQFLQNNSFSCSVQFVESNILLHIPSQSKEQFAALESKGFFSGEFPETKQPFWQTCR